MKLHSFHPKLTENLLQILFLQFHSNTTFKHSRLRYCRPDINMPWTLSDTGKQGFWGLGTYWMIYLFILTNFYSLNLKGPWNTKWFNTNDVMACIYFKLFLAKVPCWRKKENVQKTLHMMKAIYIPPLFLCPKWKPPLKSLWTNASLL
jgi:hypothetical protein